MHRRRWRMLSNSLRLNNVPFSRARSPQPSKMACPTTWNYNSFPQLARRKGYGPFAARSSRTVESYDRVSLQDITDRKRVESDLRASEERYRMLFDSNPHPMWVYDVQTLRFLEVNDAAVMAYGYTRDEFLSMTIRDIRPADELPRFEANIARTNRGLERSELATQTKGWNDHRFDVPAMTCPTNTRTCAWCLRWR